MKYGSLFFMLLSTIAYAELKETHQPLYKHTFIYNARESNFNPTSVNIVGEFNGYSIRANPMTQVAPKIFKTEIVLPEGEYFYHLNMTNDKGERKYQVDWKKQIAENTIPKENVFYVGPQATFGYGDNSNFLGNIRQDLLNNHLKVLHDPNSLRYFSFVKPNLIRILCRMTAKAAPLVKIFYRLNGEVDNSWHSKRMEKIYTENEWDFFSITIADYTEGKLEYFFEFSDSVTSVKLGNNILSEDLEKIYKNPFISPLSASKTSPNWAIDGIWYEIIMDRFRNGDLQNDSIDTKNWNEWQDERKLQIIYLLYGWARNDRIQSPIKAWVEKKYETLVNQYNSMINELSFGGDIQGIIDKLNYLKELGVNCLYLTPIFTGHGVHRYHTIDIRHVDDAFGVKGSYQLLQGETDDPLTWQWSGSDLMFLKFLEVAHQQGFRVVIDLNLHSLYKKSPWFLDALKNKDKSKYKDWFIIEKFGKPNGTGALYQSWDEIYHKNEMPRFASTSTLNYTDSLKNFLFSAMLRWLSPNGDPSKGVDGFRIDSPRSLPANFALEMRSFIKAHKPEALLIGENWETSYTWNQLNIYDGIQDVEWTKNVYLTFVGMSKSLQDYSTYLNQLFKSNSITSILNSWHALNNHDTMRFLSMITNPTASFRPEILNYQLIKTPTDLDYERLYQAVVLQFTCFGAPMIYYGDEVGMWGYGDPFNRAPMWWEDKQGLSDKSKETLAFYKKILNLRNTLLPLRRGNFQILPLDTLEGVVGFSRNVENDFIYVIFNRSAQEKIVELPIKNSTNQTFIDYLNPDSGVSYVVKEGRISLKLKPWKTALLRKK